MIISIVRGGRGLKNDDINIIILYSEGKTIKTCRGKNDDFYHKGREGGGHRVMIEIIIRGRP